MLKLQSVENDKELLLYFQQICCDAPICYLVGRLKVNLSDVDLNELAKEHEFRGVKVGGYWKPSGCEPRCKVNPKITLKQYFSTY